MKSTSLNLVVLLLLLSSCQSVDPWERGMLARSEMQMDTNTLDSRLKNQIYFSKEASSGGTEVAGAGCGCN